MSAAAASARTAAEMKRWIASREARRSESDVGLGIPSRRAISSVPLAAER